MNSAQLTTIFASGAASWFQRVVSHLGREDGGAIIRKYVQLR